MRSSFLVIDTESEFYLVQDPKPGIPWFLVQSIEKATKFKTHREALAAIDAATDILASYYPFLDLHVA